MIVIAIIGLLIGVGSYRLAGNDQVGKRNVGGDRSIDQIAHIRPNTRRGTGANLGNLMS